VPLDGVFGALVAGSFFGTALGAKAYVSVPEDIIAMAIGAMMLVAIWVTALRLLYTALAGLLA
jgi:hypothetical protein